MNADRPPWKTRLMLHGVFKDRNLAALKAIAAAFQLSDVCVVGKRKMEKEPLNPHGFRNFKEALKTLSLGGDKHHILVGIEIHPSAVPAHRLAVTIHERFPSCESVTFLPGNEGTGLSQAEAESCDLFVYVPQFCQIGGGGAGSLNVATATAVVVHQFFNTSTSVCPTTVDDVPSKRSIVPVVPFSSEAEGTHRAHFLVRSATSLGAARLAVVSSDRRVHMGRCAIWNTPFGRNMRFEAHCNLENYCSVFQALRDVAATSGPPSIVVGIETVEGGGGSLPLRSANLRDSVGPGATLVLVFCGMEGVLSDEHRDMCSLVCAVPVSGPISLDQLLSIVLCECSLQLGVQEGMRGSGDDGDNESNKFLVVRAGEEERQEGGAVRRRSLEGPLANRNMPFARYANSNVMPSVLDEDGGVSNFLMM